VVPDFGGDSSRADSKHLYINACTWPEQLHPRSNKQSLGTQHTFVSQPLLKVVRKQDHGEFGVAVGAAIRREWGVLQFCKHALSVDLRAGQSVNALKEEQNSGPAQAQGPPNLTFMIRLGADRLTMGNSSIVK
jgi:hypothetical protein